MRIGTALALAMACLPAGCGRTAYESLRRVSAEGDVTALSGPRPASPTLFSAGDMAAIAPYSALRYAQAAALPGSPVEWKCHYRLESFKWAECSGEGPEGSHLLEIRE